MIVQLAFLLSTTIPAVSAEQPMRQPQLAVSGNTVALVFGSDHTILFARSTDSGRNFSKPIAVATMPGLALGRHRGPRVAFAGNSIVVSAAGSPPDGNLLAWRSTDNGNTWSQPVTINDSAGSAREGLHAMAADTEGRLAAVWLDLRSKGTRLYGAFSQDGGATWSKNLLVYESDGGTICQCCHPSLLALGNGEFAVMFRNVEGESRDMYLLRVRQGAVVSTPVKLGHDSWRINACPMDGGGLAAADGRILTAWRRADEIYLARPGEAETRLGTGKDVAVAAHGDRVFAIWTAKDGIELWSSGKNVQLSRTGAFPVVKSLPDGGALAAWEENGAITIRRLE